jgi:predicted transcriptional regulator
MMSLMGQWFNNKTGVADATNLGHLERELMEHVWKLDEVSVSTVHEQLGGRLAYTTIMTTLDRLFKKGVLQRRKQGRAFMYSARFSREQFKQSLVKKALDYLLQEHNKETAPLMAYLVETFKEHDARLLDELERMIQQSRERGKRKTEK